MFVQHFTQQVLFPFDLVAEAQQVKLGDRNANLLTYNGQVPDPRLEAKPGDIVQLRFLIAAATFLTLSTWFR